MQHHFQPRRELGKTGFIASQIGIGDLADRNVPVDKCVATLLRAIDAGLNVIDTAPSYENGYSEQIVGQALRGRRDGMFLIDKVDVHHEPVAPQVEASLSRLALDHTDAFVFHGVSKMEAWNLLAAPGGGMEQLRACIAQGKTRFAGISSHHPDVLEAAISTGLCDLVMFAVGPYCDSRFVERILPLTRAKGIATVCFKTFGAGKLLGDTAGYGRPLQERPRGKFSSGGQESPASPLLPHLSVRECVHYTLTCDPDVALLGMSFPNEQDAALSAAADFTPLTAGQMADIRGRAEQAIQGKGPCWWNPNP